MNNQYEYAEKPLTPSIAEKLIQELFAGQTVEKREIMRIVDETHSERGGRPSRARFHHPVTLALSKMKRSGLLDNPSRGIWIIHSEGLLQVANLTADGNRRLKANNHEQTLLRR